LWDVWEPATTSWGMKNDSACFNKHHPTGFVGNKLDMLIQYQRRASRFSIFPFFDLRFTPKDESGSLNFGLNFGEFHDLSRGGVYLFLGWFKHFSEFVEKVLTCF
jgi:hypothetical protein